jgi:hypothetical protein
MKTTICSIGSTMALILIGLLFSTAVHAQGGRSGFWGDVQYGGGFGVSSSANLIEPFKTSSLNSNHFYLLL